MARAKEKLVALAARVSTGRLTDPARIGAAAGRIIRASGVGRCFATTTEEGFFSWDHDEEAYVYDTELLVGHYVLSTSLSKEEASVGDIVRHYRALQRVERRFRVMKDFLGLRPIDHFTEERMRGHLALCVLAAVIEAVTGKDLARASVKDPTSPTK
jgi:transposase